MATARELTANWQNLCDIQGMDPAVILNYTCIIPTFGGVATTVKVGRWGAPPSHVNTLESLSIPWDCMVVGATVKYLNGGVAGGCAVVNVTSALNINCTSASGSIVAAAASIAGGTSSTVIALTNAEISGKHFQKSATGLTVSLGAGSQLFVSSLVMVAGVDNTGPITSDLSVSLQIAVAQSKLALTTSGS